MSGQKAKTINRAILLGLCASTFLTEADATDCSQQFPGTVLTIQKSSNPEFAIPASEKEKLLHDYCVAAEIVQAKFRHSDGRVITYVELDGVGPEAIELMKEASTKGQAQISFGMLISDQLGIATTTMSFPMPRKLVTVTVSCEPPSCPPDLDQLQVNGEMMPPAKRLLLPDGKIELVGLRENKKACATTFTTSYPAPYTALCRAMQ